MIADDSGLEVEGLGGLPGIHSARYAGEKAKDAENVAKLLKMLQIRSPGNRKALFRCALVAYDPSGAEHVVEGVVNGTISANVRGTTG
ncbi:non-canonical purine NTP pyrophosphatase, partial [Escherichia coli]|uniref:non-canonical purine NTP pyrophosphatase n=1 Tax=Escherichia coli TaxID=562 RepID=UPI002117D767